MIEKIYYLFGFVYLATVVWHIVKFIIRKIKNQQLPDPLQLNPTDLSSLKKHITIGFYLTILNLLWMISGLWSPEQIYFIILFALNLLYMFAPKPENSDVSYLLWKLFKFGIVSTILYLHYQPLLQ